MKPHIHAKNSVRNHGGRPENYQAIHDFIDSSKAAVPDMRHRAVLHSAFGIFIVEKVFGVTLKNGPEACAGRRFTFRKERAARFPTQHVASLILSRGARPRFEPCIWILLDEEENEVREMDVKYYELQEVK